MSYVLDDPESKAAACIKGGSTMYPCELCSVPHEHLANLGIEWPTRTEAEQRVGVGCASTVGGSGIWCCKLKKGSITHSLSAHCHAHL